MILPSLLLLLSLLIVPSRGSELCYHCTSGDCVVVQECARANPLYLQRIRETFFPEVQTAGNSSSERMPEPVCFTSITRQGDGAVVTERGCSPLGWDLTCMVLRSSTAQGAHLQGCVTCDMDLCNSASLPGALITLLVTLLLVTRS